MGSIQRSYPGASQSQATLSSQERFEPLLTAEEAAKHLRMHHTRAASAINGYWGGVKS